MTPERIERVWRLVDVLITAATVVWFVLIAWWMKLAADTGHIGNALVYLLIDVLIAVRYMGRGRS